MPPPSRGKRRRPAWQNVLRWTVGAAAMAATWGYGAWKGGSVMWIGIPVGVIVMVCTAAALTIPLVTAALVTVAFIYGIDAGIVPATRNVAAAVVIIGLAVSGWQFVTRLRDRDRRR